MNEEELENIYKLLCTNNTTNMQMACKMIEGRGFTLSSIICKLWNKYKKLNRNGVIHFPLGNYTISHVYNHPRFRSFFIVSVGMLTQMSETSGRYNSIEYVAEFISCHIKDKINHDRRF